MVDINLKDEFEAPPPEHIYKYGVFEHPSGWVDFIRLTEKQGNGSPLTQLPPSKIEVYDIHNGEWNQRRDLMNEVNDLDFEFLEKDEFYQRLKDYGDEHDDVIRLNPTAS